jgi:hypothetical protein
MGASTRAAEEIDGTEIRWRLAKLEPVEETVRTGISGHARPALAVPVQAVRPDAE